MKQVVVTDEKNGAHGPKQDRFDFATELLASQGQHFSSRDRLENRILQLQQQVTQACTMLYRSTRQALTHSPPVAISRFINA
jgi:hypothetical protein